MGTNDSHLFIYLFTSSPLYLFTKPLLTASLSQKCLKNSCAPEPNYIFQLSNSLISWGGVFLTDCCPFHSPSFQQFTWISFNLSSCLNLGHFFNPWTSLSIPHAYPLLSFLSSSIKVPSAFYDHYMFSHHPLTPVRSHLIPSVWQVQQYVLSWYLLNDYGL